MTLRAVNQKAVLQRGGSEFVGVAGGKDGDELVLEEHKGPCKSGFNDC